MARFPLRHLPALDGLRGLAVAGVLLFHAGHLSGGYLGVDLFFVLSGFLITTLLLTEWDSDGTISLRRFWLRRARRLLPAVFVVLLGVVAYAVFVADPVELDGIRWDSVATLAYVANWRAILTGDGYWDLFTVPSPLEHTWSLAIEEQFYLVWPLVVLGLLRWARPRGRWTATGEGRLSDHQAATVLAVALGGVALLGAWALWLFEPGGDATRVYLGTDTRAPAVLLGAALAAWLQWRGPATGRARTALEVGALVAVVGLGWAWTSLEGRDELLYRGGLLAAGAAVVVVIASVVNPRGGPIAAVLSFAPLRWLGLISYGLYLWHWPVFITVRRQLPDLDGWSLAAVQLACSLVPALLSYHFVEQPIRRHGLAGLPKRVLAPAVAAVTMILVVVGTVPPTDPGSGLLAGDERGAEAELPPPIEPVTTPSPPSTTEAHGAPATSIPAEGETPRVMVVGDSVAFYLGQALVAEQGALGVEVANRGVIACGLSRAPRIRYPDGGIGQARPECDTWPERWAADVAAFRPHVVVLLIGNPPSGDPEVDGRFVPPCSEAFDEWYTAEVTEAIEVLGSAGATVAVATAPYSRFAFRPDDLDERTDCVNDLYRRAVREHGAGSVLVELDEWVCPDDCLEEVDGVVLRPDGVHLEGDGATLAVQWLLPEVLTRAGIPMASTAPSSPPTSMSPPPPPSPSIATSAPG